MWEQQYFRISNNRSSGTSNMSKPFASDIHILLVDHEKELLISTARMLELCSYKVTVVELATTALLMLSKGKENFDLVMMANAQPPDMYGFQLFKEVDRLCLPMILLSSSSNHDLARTAIETGAILFIERPTTPEVLMYLWQLVMCDKRRRITLEDEYIRCNEDYGVQIQDNSTSLRILKKKECTQWTKELHGKFVDAVNQLGEGRCYPKEILYLMNVPGLTRTEVSSHLQKCRHMKWKTPKEHNITTSNNGQSNISSIALTKEKRRLGIFPQLHDDKNQEPLETQPVKSNEREGVLSHWQSDYHILLHAPSQWHNNSNNPEGNIDSNGQEDLVHQYGMPNFDTSGNSYFPLLGSSLAAPQQHHEIHGTNGNFGSKMDYVMQNYNLQAQTPSASQCQILNGTDMKQPLHY